MRAAEAAVNGADSRRRLRDEATSPELLAWIDDNPDRARRLGPDEVSELLLLQNSANPLTVSGVNSFVERMERRRALVSRVTAIAGTRYLELLEQFVGLLFEKVQPPPERH